MVKLIKKYPTTLVFISYMVIEICKVTGIVCGPAFQRLYDFSDTQLGLIFSALALGGLIMNLGIGTVATKIGLWKVWKLGIVGSIIAMIIVPISLGFWTVFLPIFLLGIATIFTLNANNTYLTEIFSTKAQQTMALASGLWFGSSVLSTPIIGLWVEWATQNNMPRATFAVPYIIDIALLTLILLLGMKFLKPIIAKADTFRDHNNKNNSDQLDDNPGIFDWVAIIAIAYFHGSLVVVLKTWSNPMVQQKFEVADFKGSLTFCALAVGIAIGRITLASGILKIDNRSLLMFSGFVGGTLATIMLVINNYWFTIVAIAVSALCLSTTAPCMLAMVPEKFKRVKSHTFGYMGSSIGAAAFLSPWLVGMMADYGIAIDRAMFISPISAFLLGITALAWKIKDRTKHELI